VHTLHIISTGISLLTNFAKAKVGEIEGISPANAHKYSQLLSEFLSENPVGASAEINSLQDRTGFLSQSKGASMIDVTLIYTETEQGKCVASLIEKFLKDKVKNVHRIPLRGFDKPAQDVTHEYAKEAAQDALLTLKGKVDDHIYQMKKQNLQVELNITGGYKAECAVLYALGSSKGIPVYYRHETFQCCIELPQVV
jgi:putative CRISPR-associated protein (TIGR02619 family)